MAKGFGPGAVAVAVFGVADEAEFAAGGDFFFDAAEVGVEGGVARDAEAAVFEITTECESEFFLEGGGEVDGLDFPAETFAGALSELDAHAGFVDASAFELGKAEERVEVGFDFGEGFVMELDAEAIVHDAADFFAEVDDAEVAAAGDVNTNEE